MSKGRRKLSAVDDPLTLLGGQPQPSPRRPATTERTAALYVRLPAAESDLLARAAFELRVYKRDLIAALIATHVDPHTDDGLASLRQALELHSQRSG